jgi:hypothetical protein
MNTTQLKWHVLGVLLAVLLMGGCKGVSMNRVATITADENVCQQSVEVHLVGVSRFKKEQWENYSMTKYWQPNNQLRKSASEYTHVIQYGKAPCERKLLKDNLIRKKWETQKAEYLFVLVDLPGIFEDAQGNADARRLRLPALNSKEWGFQKEIKIAISSSNVVALTIPKKSSR